MVPDVRLDLRTHLICASADKQSVSSPSAGALRSSLPVLSFPSAIYLEQHSGPGCFPHDLQGEEYHFGPDILAQRLSLYRGPVLVMHGNGALEPVLLSASADGFALGAPLREFDTSIPEECATVVLDVADSVRRPLVAALSEWLLDADGRSGEIPRAVFLVGRSLENAITWAEENFPAVLTEPADETLALPRLKDFVSEPLARRTFTRVQALAETAHRLASQEGQEIRVTSQEIRELVQLASSDPLDPSKPIHRLVIALERLEEDPATSFGDREWGEEFHSGRTKNAVNELMKFRRIAPHHHRRLGGNAWERQAAAAIGQVQQDTAQIVWVSEAVYRQVLKTNPLSLYELSRIRVASLAQLLALAWADGSLEAQDPAGVAEFLRREQWSRADDERASVLIEEALQQGLPSASDQRSKTERIALLRGRLEMGRSTSAWQYSLEHGLAEKDALGDLHSVMPETYARPSARPESADARVDWLVQGAWGEADFVWRLAPYQAEFPVSPPTARKDREEAERRIRDSADPRAFLVAEKLAMEKEPHRQRVGRFLLWLLAQSSEQDQSLISPKVYGGLTGLAQLWRVGRDYEHMARLLAEDRASEQPLFVDSQLTRIVDADGVSMLERLEAEKASEE